MPAWPSTLPSPSWGGDGEDYVPQDKVEFEANYVQARRTATRGRTKLSLVWSLMSTDDYKILKAFFYQYQGTIFTYTDSIEGITRNFVFSGSSIKWKRKSPGWLSDVQCPIEEV